VSALPVGTAIGILAPVVRRTPGDHAERLTALARDGFVRVVVDGRVLDLAEPITLDPAVRHDIDVYVDRLKIKDGIRSRLADSLQTAATLGDGRVEVEVIGGERLRFSERYTDAAGDLAYPELTPSALSFNSPHGACPRCDGLGRAAQLDLALLVPDPEAAMPQAVVPWQGRAGASWRKGWKALARRFGVAPETPWSGLPEELKLAVLEGTGDADDVAFVGLRAQLGELAAQTGDDEDGGFDGAAYFREVSCPACEGTGLRIEARMGQVRS